MTLNDLRPDRWQIIAVSEIAASGLNAWRWDLERYDRDALHLAREGGAVLIAQKRVEPGTFALVAKLRRVR